MLKDAFPRFKTMQGFHVPRRAGWDCHGLPVEVAVEKELGLTSKRDIEAYGITAFNARCRESVLRHVDAFAEFTERMGYWIDLSQAYRTMDPSYIESVWWSLKQIYEQGPARPGLPDQPVLPALRDAAVRPRDGPAGRVPDGRRPVGDRPVPAADAAAGRAAAAGRRRPAGVDDHAVDAGLEHRGRGAPGRDLRDRPQVRRRATGWSSQMRCSPGCSARAGTSPTGSPGRELAGATYEPPFRLIDVPDAHRVVTGTFVTTEDGTGLVHLAPAFGADDMAAGREHGLPVVNPVLPDGRFEEDIPLVGGLFFKAADPAADREPVRPGPAVRLPAARAQLPALLALRHAAAVLRAAVVVHPHDRDPGPAARGERGDELAAAHDQARPVRGLAAQQRRLGAVQDPVLGHAAADLACARRTTSPAWARWLSCRSWPALT